MRKNRIKNYVKNNSLFVCLLLGMFISLLYLVFIVDKEPAKEPPKVAHKIKNACALEKTVFEDLSVMAEKNYDVLNIMNQCKNYSPDILKLLSKNIETLDFVQDFPKMKDSKVLPKSVGTLKKGEIPLLIQWDKRWGYLPYGDRNIALNGCAPTALSMIISGLKQDSSITPKVIADFAYKKGYYVKGHGTDWGVMTAVAKEYGIKEHDRDASKESLLKELKLGRPLICSVKPGDFTTSGHYIVITGYKEGKFVVNDPNSLKNSEKLWTHKVLYPQISNVWSFSLK